LGNEFRDDAFVKQDTKNLTESFPPEQQKQHQVTEEFLVFKENQDILNKEISQKEIETELLRLDQYHFHINFNNYKGPDSNEMTMMKDRIPEKTIKTDRTILSKSKELETLEQISPSDLDYQFYHDLNNHIIQ